MRHAQTSSVWAKHTRSCEAGFTLVELLVVVAIIVMLIAILLPSLSRARQQAVAVRCLSNLRQMVTAAQTYAAGNGDSYPFALCPQPDPPPGPPSVTVNVQWDFTTTMDWSTTPPKSTSRPGLLWEGQGNNAVQQCPGFQGAANSYGDPYTGYNYNTSFIGHGELDPTDPAGVLITPPVKVSSVRKPATTALFGDGQYGGGANKYMRSPFLSPVESFYARYAGTQGFRHLGKTNVAYCDGHAEPQGQRYTTTYQPTRVAPGTGFLSADNSAYDPQ